MKEEATEKDHDNDSVQQNNISRIWGVLYSYRENCISEGDERNESEWEEICAAMNAITDRLKRKGI